MGLDGSTCSECLPVVTCDFNPPEHVPRTSTRAYTCAVVFGRAPCVPRSREHEKRPGAGREKRPYKKNTFIHSNIQRKYNKIPGTYMRGTYTHFIHVASGLFSWSTAAGLFWGFQVASLHLLIQYVTIDHGPLSASHNNASFFIFPS